MHFADRHSAGLLQLIVDDAAYAIAYGQGYRVLPGEIKDHRFGLEFAIRALDLTHVHKLMRRRPGAGSLLPQPSPHRGRRTAPRT